VWCQSSLSSEAVMSCVELTLSFQHVLKLSDTSVFYVGRSLAVLPSSLIPVTTKFSRPCLHTHKNCMNVAAGPNDGRYRQSARRWHNHKPGARLTYFLPGSRLPFQSQNVALWPVPAAWWNWGTCEWTTCPGLLPDSETARSWTCDSTANRRPNHYFLALILYKVV